MDAKVSGLADLVTDTEEELFEETRKLIGFLPLNCQVKKHRHVHLTLMIPKGAGTAQ